MFQAITKFPHLRVLALEDHVNNYELLEAMLLDFACDFEIVDNSAEALELHALNPFDIILIDILVPDLETKEAVNKLRTIPGRVGHPYIIVVAELVYKTIPWITGHSYIKKPLKIRDLEQTFLRLLPIS